MTVGVDGEKEPQQAVGPYHSAQSMRGQPLPEGLTVACLLASTASTQIPGKPVNPPRLMQVKNYHLLNLQGQLLQFLSTYWLCGRASLAYWLPLRRDHSIIVASKLFGPHICP